MSEEKKSGGVVKWFATGFGAAAGVTFSVMIGAAPGDYVYAQSKGAELSVEQAACFADCAVSAGLFDGKASNVQQTCMQIEQGHPTGIAVGLKTISPSELKKANDAGADIEVLGSVK